MNIIDVSEWSLDQKIDKIESIWKKLPVNDFFKHNPELSPRFDRSKAIELYETGHIGFLCGKQLQLNVKTTLWDITIYNIPTKIL